MENNKTNAIAFFASNIFCEAGCNAAVFNTESNSKNENGKLIMSPSILADIHEGTFGYRDFYLIQTEASKIDNETALVFHEIYSGVKKPIDYCLSVLEELRDIENRLPNDSYDYLKSKSIALPWRGLSVKEQVEYGWIKLKES